MPSYYENLVAKIGEEKAREQMKAIRAKRKVNKGGGFNNPATILKAIEKRNANKDNKI